MQTCWTCRWPLWALIALLTVISLPSWAGPPREMTLNGITLNSSFLDVLTRKGKPHYIGPAFKDAEQTKLAIETPPPSMNPMGSGMPGQPGMMPGAMGPGMSPVAVRKVTPPDDYVIWMYQGSGKEPNPNARYATYVFFNRRGLVIAVVVTADDPSISVPGAVTASGKTIGSRMMDVIATYDWPDPFTSVASQYYCSYPDRNITFSLDQKTRRVKTICLGFPMTVTAVMDTTQGGMAGMPGPGMPPGMPGMPGR